MKLLINLLSFLFIAGSASAALKYEPDYKTVHIFSTTDDYTAIALKNLLLKEDVLLAVLDGPGGSAPAGLYIGRLLHQYDVDVLIPKGKTCASACALAAMGGKRIIVDGELWFHGPFLQTIPINKSPQDYGSVLSAFNIEVGMYLQSVGVNLAFYKLVLQKSSLCAFFVVDDEEIVNEIKNGEPLSIPILVDDSFCTKPKPEVQSP